MTKNILHKAKNTNEKRHYKCQRCIDFGFLANYDFLSYNYCGNIQKHHAQQMGVKWVNFFFLSELKMIKVLNFERITSGVNTPLASQVSAVFSPPPLNRKNRTLTCRTQVQTNHWHSLEYVLGHYLAVGWTLDQLLHARGWSPCCPQQSWIQLNSPPHASSTRWWTILSPIIKILFNDWFISLQHPVVLWAIHRAKPCKSLPRFLSTFKWGWKLQPLTRCVSSQFLCRKDINL